MDEQHFEAFFKVRVPTGVLRTYKDEGSMIGVSVVQPEAVGSPLQPQQGPGAGERWKWGLRGWMCRGQQVEGKAQVQPAAGG